MAREDVDYGKFTATDADLLALLVDSGCRNEFQTLTVSGQARAGRLLGRVRLRGEPAKVERRPLSGRVYAMQDGGTGRFLAVLDPLPTVLSTETLRVEDDRWWIVPKEETDDV